MVVVSDTTALTTLVKCGLEQVLPALYSEVLVPQAVADELLDFEGNGQSNEAKWTALTDPGNATSRFSATSVRNDANLEIAIPTAPGRTHTLLQSAIRDR